VLWISRVGVFFSQNSALIFNIGRWVILIKSLEGFAEIKYRTRVKRWVGAAAAVNLVFIAYFLTLVLLRDK